MAKLPKGFSSRDILDPLPDLDYRPVDYEKILFPQKRETDSHENITLFGGY